MAAPDYIPIAIELERSGLVWEPEIGDEVADRGKVKRVSILVDPRGLSPQELRDSFIWIPTVEQLVQQLEARQAMIYHAGVTQSLIYQAVVRTSFGVVETSAQSLRGAFAKALKSVIESSVAEILH
ncbi:MAG: hypothetical protein U0136_14635 [Bdellovibrionota bacterium]